MPVSAAEEIRIGGIGIQFLLEGKESNGMLAMFEWDVEPGGKVPAAHSHDAYEETAYCLEGVMTFTVEGRRHDLRPGDVLCIKRGAVHRFDNFGTEKAKGLAVITPGILGPEYFREIAEVIRAAAGGPPDAKAIEAVMLRHGLTPAPNA